MADESQPQRRARALLWILIGGGAFFLFLLAVFALLYITLRPAGEASTSVFGGGDRIGVVDLEGLIVTPEVVVRQLKRFGDDDSIKAIVLHINTPGGGVAATEEIYQEIRRIEREKHKKVIASVETVGASGGYFVASACNKIFADKGSIVGSIGVIAEWVNYGKLLDWAKLQDVTLKAGKLKDAGSPTRPMTPEEKAYFQGLLDNMHTQFIQAVADGRHLKAQDIQSIADGRVWTGDQALPLHLIDQIGDFRAAVADTARSVGIKGEPQLVRPEKERRTLLDLLFGDLSNFLPDRIKLLQRQQVGFYYVWQ
jgi:protease IV